ncbi:chloride channel protein (voltage gated) [Legionella londiniensis]|uniref:Chloride channel protein (Voltage gated) n=1 Tax=Legionella londiniensis TaxID=45068 RepID=A0A0W0VM37_9GAMM|nr:chloride channel protein (voltage gated) [Legionella londiniensis]
MEGQVRTQRAMPQQSSTPVSILICSTVVVGIGAGIGGTLLALLLRTVQHLAYGYSPWHLVSNETFLEGVRAASPIRRVLVLSLCGIIAGFGWWLLYRYGKPLLSIEEALKKKAHMPKAATMIHVLLQIITVGLGSPLGRETAPREFGAVFADWFSNKIGLSPRDAKIMLACGAGAGLAAVYNVPLGGAIFTLEVLLVTIEWSILLRAFATSVIAVLISWLGLGNHPQYQIATYELNHSLLLWSVLCGPVFGVAAYWFNYLVNGARRNAARNWQLPVLCFINFLMIGFLAAFFPAILGNGKSPAQLEFDAALTLGASLSLLALRVGITWSTLRAGGRGGILTPALANGSLLAAVLGGLWNLYLPGSSLNAYALIGAAAFLAASQKMPLTAIILIFEFTHIKFSFLVPILLAVTGAVGLFRLCDARCK